MYEIVRHATSEENVHTIHRLESTTVDDSILDRPRREVNKNNERE
jgi:hypothetical protein